MAMSTGTDACAYLDLLRGDPAEIRAARQGSADSRDALLPGSGSVRLLAKNDDPGPVARRAVDHSLRVWVAGCSSGEETYSIAMLCAEAIAAADRTIRLQIFASDVDAEAIASRPQGSLSGINRDRRVAGAACPLLRQRGSGLSRIVGAARGGRFRGPGFARRSAFLAARHGLLPEPAHLLAARRSGKGSAAIPLRVARGRPTSSWQLGDDWQRRRPFQRDLEGGPTLSSRRSEPSGRIRIFEEPS